MICAALVADGAETRRLSYGVCEVFIVATSLL